MKQNRGSGGGCLAVILTGHFENLNQGQSSWFAGKLTLRGENNNNLICTVWRYPWTKYVHHGRFQATNNLPNSCKISKCLTNPVSWHEPTPSTPTGVGIRSQRQPPCSEVSWPGQNRHQETSSKCSHQSSFILPSPPPIAVFTHTLSFVNGFVDSESHACASCLMN